LIAKLHFAFQCLEEEAQGGEEAEGEAGEGGCCDF